MINAGELPAGTGLSRESPVSAKQPRLSAASPTPVLVAGHSSSRGRRKFKVSPTQRSLKHMRDLGYLCAIVEHWNQFAHIRQDLFGFIDILCVHEETGNVVGVQSTSGDNVAARVTKIAEHENWTTVCKSPIKVVVHGWRKNAAGKWVLREVEL